MKFVSGVMLLGFALAIAPGALAHEGHLHKLMGTVAAVSGERLQVKATTGATSEIVVNDKTRILRGATAQKTSDIKPGERIVVTMTESKDQAGKALLTATEIRLAPQTATDKGPQKAAEK
jgi:hypothetical protein